MYPNYFSITLFLILVFAGLNDAIAEMPVQGDSNAASIDSSLVKTETNPLNKPSLPTTELEKNSSHSLYPPSQGETPERFGPPVDPCVIVNSSGETWLDQLHVLVQQNTCKPALWFDNFFGREHDLEDLRPGTIIIIRNSARLTKGLKVAYIGDFNIGLELPQMEKLLKKARLFIQTGYDGNNIIAQPGQPIEPGVNRETGDRQTIIGFRIDPYTRLRSLVSIDSGIKINMHPDAFIRMRYQYRKDFGELYLIRFLENAMWQAIEHFSNTSQIDIERKLTMKTLIRWGNSVTFIEDTPGITWNTGVSIFTQITPRSAISYDTSMWGVNYPEWVVQNYRVGSHYRRNIYRPWLFFEFSPEVTWPQNEKDENNHRKPTYALIGTIEVQFGK
ncbi:MAG: hypothetical protein HZA08_09230 [Nitrospirae bacterium]|nr:hypothetical protein [Nitrospirota bacterium]